MRDLKLEIGEKITPMYNAALDVTATVLEKIVKFVREHGTATRILATAFAGLGGVLTVVGTLASVFGNVLGSVNVLRFATSMVSAFRLVGQAFMVLGRLALANPVIAVISLIAAAAIYVWQNWDTLGPKFIALWETIKGAFGAAGDWITAKWDATVEWVKTAIGGIGDWFGDIGTRFQEIGASLVSARRRHQEPLRRGEGDGRRPGQFDARLGQGETRHKGVDHARRRHGRRPVAHGPHRRRPHDHRRAGRPARVRREPAIAAAAPLERYNLSLDYRAPLTAPAVAAASAAPASGPVTINIAPPPGADAAEIARMVRAELERAERAKASRAGSRLSD